jgi:hypothetical protein
VAFATLAPGSLGTTGLDPKLTVALPDQQPERHVDAEVAGETSRRVLNRKFATVAWTIESSAS